jgi:glycosyltransferase involved in cell wall biosynthesis
MVSMSSTLEVFVLSYNNSKYIESTVESLACQKECEVSITIIDDCSTDNSIDILNRLKELYSFTLIVNPKNLGIVKNVNKAIKLAKLEYFALHSSDDLSDPYRFSHQLQQLYQYPEVDFVVSDMKIIGHNRKNPKKLISKRFNINDILNLKSKTTGCVTYRTAAIKLITLNEKYISEEPQIHLKVLLEGSGFWLKDNFLGFEYRVHEANLTNTRMPEMLLQHMDLIQDMQHQMKVDLSQYSNYVRSAYISSLAENNTFLAFKILICNYRVFFSKGIFRILIKILLPYDAIKLFKKKS